MIMQNIGNQNTFNRDELLDFYSGRCLLNPSHEAVCIHEIHPKSQRPNTWNTFLNCIPLCAECHDKIHSEGAGNGIEKLEKLRDNWIEKYGK